MWILGIAGGLIVGFIASQIILTLLYSGGRHLAIKENKNLRIISGLFGILIMFSGAYVGYLIAS